MPTLLVPYHLEEHLPELAADLPGPPDVTLEGPPPLGDPWPWYSALHERVAAAVAGTTRPAVVSGDCVVAAGVLAGLQRAGHDPAVVWFDAHGDLHTTRTSTSGYPGGTSLRLLTGHRPAGWTGVPDLAPVAEERVVLVGARDLDPAEAGYLETSPIRRADVGSLEPADLPDGPLLLHVDVDVVDAVDLPGLLFPVAEGPSADAVTAAIGRVVATGRVVALDIAATWSAAPSVDATSSRTRLLRELLSAHLSEG